VKKSGLSAGKYAISLTGKVGAAGKNDGKSKKVLISGFEEVTGLGLARKIIVNFKPKFVTILQLIHGRLH
jgi:hypothetical protein